MTSYVVIFVVSLLLINAWMYFQQPRMIFYPYPELFQTPADWGLDFEDVTLQTNSAARLALKPEDDLGAAVLSVTDLHTSTVLAGDLLYERQAETNPAGGAGGDEGILEPV